MSWPMSHLYIAQNILSTGKINVKNISQYYLGTIAPDAIHFRDNYDRSQKRVSHLYEKIDKSNIDNYVKEWELNTINFFNNNCTKDNFDFILGYCLHLMADIYMYKHVWKPFIELFKDRNDINYHDIYNKENLAVDFDIFKNQDYKQKLFMVIKESQEIDFCGLITKNDLNGIKNNILNVQYNEKIFRNSKENKYVLLEKSMEINDKIIEYTKEQFIDRVEKSKTST